MRDLMVRRREQRGRRFPFGKTWRQKNRPFPAEGTEWNRRKYQEHRKRRNKIAAESRRRNRRVG
jgi:hypothetical protein